MNVRTAEGTINRRHVVFAIYVSMVALLDRTTLLRLYELWQENPTASHVLLTPFIAEAPIYQRRDTITEF
jgi:hypothetical protein